MSSRSSDGKKNEMHTGSPQSGEPLYIVVGKIRRPHGIHGELSMELLTDFPGRFKKGASVLIGADHTPYTISSFRIIANGALIAFEGLTDCDQAGILRNQLVYGITDDSPKLAEGEYYQHEVLGMHVIDEQGKPLGKVDEIIETGANDVYVVVDEQNKEILLPAIKSVILRIDREKSEMVVRPPIWD